jgi:hypothetical protein
MKSIKLKSATHALLLASAAAGAMLFAPPVYSSVYPSAGILRQEPVPSCKEIIQSAQKALGGAEFFEPKPYELNYTRTSDDPWNGHRTFKSKETYKNGKLRLDVAILTSKNKKRPVDFTVISDLDKGEEWKSNWHGVKDAWGRIKDVSRPEIPCFNKTNQDSLIFDTETPNIIEQDDIKYYKFSAKFGNPELENWRVTYLINVKDNLIFRVEQISTTDPRSTVRTFTDYRRVSGVMFPHRISLDATVDKKGSKSISETIVNDLVFRDDIPDSLFEIPAVHAEFKTSNAHPEWVSPDPGLESRLKASVVDIVRNFPERNFLNTEVLDKVAKHIEGILKETGARVETKDFQVQDDNIRDIRTAGLVGNTYTNVYASYGPEAGPRIVIGAHYDAVPGAPGADDNASAVAVLLELAKYLGKNAPSVRVDLAAYTLEETGLIGSAVHAKELRSNGVDVKAMISLEMLGYFSDESKSQQYPLGLLKLLYPSRGNFICVVGKSGAGYLAKALKKSLARATPLPVESFTASASRADFIGRSDHKSFWDQGYEAVMLTDTAEFRNLYYHTLSDVPEHLDYRRMAMVTVGLEKAIRELCDR